MPLLIGYNSNEAKEDDILWLNTKEVCFVINEQVGDNEGLAIGPDGVTIFEGDDTHFITYEQLGLDVDWFTPIDAEIDEAF